ncbi:MAG: TetR/AcrR family transcriptional regulator [Anaerolineales bacterium]|nr:TetR/AcrR family transcriptional regulator [Anaerolineales bacterium]MCW5855967.1 TetR/AcrR family transcriptional regulator [Anaerolineales bacterium]
MPKLWRHTVDAHRQEVRERILSSAASLAVVNGLRGVSMAQIAEQVGITRTTLYKYFPSVEAILDAWHAGQIHTHLDHLARVAAGEADPGGRLRAVLQAYALVLQSTSRHDSDLSALLHAGSSLAEGRRKLDALLEPLLEAAAAAGQVRADIPVDELASYCLNALGAAAELNSEAATRRLVGMVIDALKP